jgi:hypothetical protein
VKLHCIIKLTLTVALAPPMFVFIVVGVILAFFWAVGCGVLNASGCANIDPDSGLQLHADVYAALYNWWRKL